MIKTLIWVAFNISIIGMFTSVVLRYEPVREIIVDSWVTVSNRLETISPSVTTQIFGKLISAFYLNGSTSISKKKILLMSSLASLVWVLFIDQWRPHDISESVGYGLFLKLILAFINLPTHFIIEYLQAIFLVLIFENTENKKPLIILLRLIILYISFLGVSLLAFVAFISSKDSIVLEPVLFPIGTAVIIPLTFTFNADKFLMNQVFILPFSITYVGGIILFCLSAVITNSKPFLRLLCCGIDRMSATAYTSIFKVSMVLFTITCGLMSAYGFYYLGK